MDAIDLFAGAGGFSTGATMAGCSVVWAANHWPAAVAVHVNNHPYCLHLWRPTGHDIPTPPSLLVGIKGLELTP